MAFVLPIIAAVGTVASAGGVVAAMSTVGGFLSVAGGVLAGVGALTGKKDLVKIGGFLSLGSAAAGAFGVGGASTGIGGAAQAAGEGAAGAAGAAELAGSGLKASQMTEGIRGLGDSAAAQGATNYSLASANAGTGEGLMFQKAQQLAQQAAQPSSLVSSAGALTQGASQGAAPMAGLSPTVPAAADYSLANAVQGAKPLPAAAGTVTQSDIASVLEKGWQRAQAALKNTGQFIKDNKELAQIGGQALASMYGPQAEQMDYQRSLMEQARRNLNSPIRLSTQGG